MFYNHQVPIEVGIGSVKNLAIIAGHHHVAIRCRQNRCTEGVEELYAVVWVTRAISRAAKAIGNFDRIRTGRRYRP